MGINIALIGDYNAQVIAHQAIPKALVYSSEFIRKNINYEWIDTEKIGNDIETQFKNYNGIWVVPASPYKNMNGVLNVIKYARENKIPFLGTCGGFQHAMIEYFRNVIGYKIADHIESNSNSEMPLISQLTCSLIEKEGEIFLKENTRIMDLCKTTKLTEKFHCNYGFNSKYIDHLNKSKLKISGVDINEEIRIVELEDHPFFIATLFQPERSALSKKNHPIINSFVSSSALY